VASPTQQVLRHLQQKSKWHNTLQYAFADCSVARTHFIVKTYVCVQSLTVQNSLFDFVSFLIRKGLCTFHRYHLTPVRLIAGRALTILPLMSRQPYSGPNMRCRPVSDIEDGFAFATFQSPFHFNEHQRDKCHSSSTRIIFVRFSLLRVPLFFTNRNTIMCAGNQSVNLANFVGLSLTISPPRRPKLFRWFAPM